MRQCPTCGKDHNKRGIYCELKCFTTQARSRTMSGIPKTGKGAKGHKKPQGFGAKVSLASTGKPKPWLVGPLNPNWKNKTQGTPEGKRNLLAGIARRPPQSAEKLRRHSEKMKGPSNAMRGKKHTQETKIAVSATKQGVPVVEWSGFLTSANARDRASIEFANWRKAVFKRDKYTCAMCGKIGGNLHPHHIKTWSKHPNVRYDTNNGITLCGHPCHSSLQRNEEKYEAMFERIVVGIKK